MFSASSKLNPSVVQTALDKVFYQEFNGRSNPGWASAENPFIFRQERMDNGAVVQQVFRGAGLWETRAEEQDVPSAAPFVGNTITYVPTNYAQSIDITKNFFDDNMHGTYEKMVRDMAETGRITRETNAFSIFNNAFTTALTSDGLSLINDAHLIGGGTVDNKMTAVLSESSLNDAIIMLSKQKAQDGTIRGQRAATLVVPLELYKLAVEITESTLRSGTSDNDTNVYSTKYGINVVTSPYLTSTTAWFLLSANHSIYRWVRQDVQTALIDWKFQRNNNYIYKGEFREVVGAVDYAGIVGSDGTA